jgi:hypothetical protein
MSGSGSWTEEIIERARRLYVEEGKSARETADILGPPFTRSAVIGKAHRMGWLIDEARSKPHRMSQEERALRQRVSARKRLARDGVAPKAPRVKPGPKLAPASGWPPRMDLGLAADVRRVRFIERKRCECIWPLGDYREAGSAEMLVCAAPVVGEHSYCALHLGLSRSARRLKPLRRSIVGAVVRDEDAERVA